MANRKPKRLYKLFLNLEADVNQRNLVKKKMIKLISKNQMGMMLTDLTCKAHSCIPVS